MEQRKLIARRARARAIARGLAPLQAATFTADLPVSVVPRVAEWAIAVEARLLPIGHRGRFFHEFHSEPHDLACANATQWTQVVYTLRQLGRVVQLRAAIRAPDRPWFSRVHRLACWVLASDWRTWGLLGPLTAFAIINVHLQQGWGSALFTLPTIVAIYAGVEWLRNRWGVTVKRRQRDDDSMTI
ncbi:hypothetical protein ITP53_27340 [Nonomuraea sp. K274]|uniref:Uncharacterized protein n=1 Tax=Nonomuraea cypriaca TaxID=1187855 RepID=A0A931F357_9ACTN|nr:hypothetical protein [Nonomuraea cypriaca]MBF8189383.1 hypothetical protein [Nonomuraea cypriaca]